MGFKNKRHVKQITLKLNIMNELTTVLKTSGNITVNDLNLNVNFERKEGELPSFITANTYDSEVMINVGYHHSTGKVDCDLNGADADSTGETVTAIISRLKEIITAVQSETDNPSGSGSTETTKNKTTKN